jgi:hypothetical protein
VRNLLWLEIVEIISAEVPKLSLVSAASSGEETMPRVKLGEVDVPSSVTIRARLL